MINTYSIKDKNLFQKVLSKGKWFSGDYICIYVLENGLNVNQIGLAIGKKLGKAYKRNHIKRLIKESYRTLESTMNYGFDVVFVWKSKANYDDCSFEYIKQDVIKTFKKAGIISWKSYVLH